MNPAPLTIEIRGMNEAENTLQAMRSVLANRGPLLAQMAVNAQQATQEYLRSDTDHATAQRLGATPTGFRSWSANQIKAASDDDAAILRIPRNTGLGRAFSEITIRPRPGRTFLTIPATARTYGKGPRDFGEEELEFAIIFTHRGPVPVFKFADTGEVAFWLRRVVTQKQDRTLLPSDDTYREIGRRTINAYIQNLIASARSGGGPYGGTSTGMPTT